MKRVRVPLLPIGLGATLDPISSHHLAHVVRAKIGTQLQLYDGTGQEQLATITSIEPRVHVEEAGPLLVRKEGPSIHLILSVLKHQAMDLALRMATEAGASVIHPVIMERTIARGDRHDRWARILTSSTSQCGRAVVPTLLPVQPLSGCLDKLEIPLLFGAPGARPAHPASTECGLIIGPAGGIAPAEEAALLRRGALPVGLGPHILRAETACAVGLGLLRAT